MALDEPKENDVLLTDQGITFVIEKDIFEEAKPINVDFVESPSGSGFSLTSNLPASGECCS
jgi:iron-sulfur cluster assembly protein